MHTESGKLSALRRVALKNERKRLKKLGLYKPKRPGWGKKVKDKTGYRVLPNVDKTQ